MFHELGVCVHDLLVFAHGWWMCCLWFGYVHDLRVCVHGLWVCVGLCVCLYVGALVCLLVHSLVRVRVCSFSHSSVCLFACLLTCLLLCMTPSRRHSILRGGGGGCGWCVDCAGEQRGGHDQHRGPEGGRCTPVVPPLGPVPSH